MCLITDNKEKQFATEDMIVYKIFGLHLQSFFMYFQYELDILYETKITESSPENWYPCCKLDENYLKENYGPSAKIWIKNPKLICLEEGFHSAKTIENLKFIGSNHVYECIIPKGSEFYTDTVGFIISNKIIVKQQILVE
jgi:hypothetical protein